MDFEKLKQVGERYRNIADHEKTRNLIIIIFVILLLLFNCYQNVYNRYENKLFKKTMEHKFQENNNVLSVLYKSLKTTRPIVY